MPERRTPFYEFHRRAARNLVKGGGDFMFPTSYASSLEEHLNVRRNVGMQDLSTMGEVDIKGPGAERLVRRLLVNEVQDMEPGQLRYSTMCNEEGGIVDDVTVYKFDDEHFMIVTSSGPRKKAFRWISEHAVGSSAYVTDMTAAVALPVVQGPRSRAFLKTVVEGVDLDELRFFRFAPCRIGDVELLISRSGYTGELGYELYTPADQAGRAVGAYPADSSRVQPEALRPGGHAVPAHREGSSPLRPRHKRGRHPLPRGSRSLGPVRQARLRRPRGPAAGPGTWPGEALGRPDPGERGPRQPRAPGSTASPMSPPSGSSWRPGPRRASRRTSSCPARGRSGASPRAPWGIPSAGCWPWHT